MDLRNLAHLPHLDLRIFPKVRLHCLDRTLNALVQGSFNPFILDAVGKLVYGRHHRYVGKKRWVVDRTRAMDRDPRRA